MVMPMPVFCLKLGNRFVRGSALWRKRAAQGVHRDYLFDFFPPRCLVGFSLMRAGLAAGASGCFGFVAHLQA